jgi:ubiquinone/menaquinone biosynthesis C-methylase UbiE
MSGTNIHFEDNTFDAIFSYSSIEHFGGKKAVLECMKEIERG